MALNLQLNTLIAAPDAPAISGLVFRGFRGEVDFPAMVAVIEGSKAADRLEFTETVEDIMRNYAHLAHCDPYADVVLAEIDGSVIGYGRVWWDVLSDGTRTYSHFAYLLPEWRGKGIRRAMLRHNERRLREIAAGQPDTGPRFFDAESADTSIDWTALLESEGYRGARYFFQMVRPDLENIPNLPLPEGLEVRPAPPEHYRTVWEAAEEAFQDHWGAIEWLDEWYAEWQQSPTFQPELWQVAWEGDEVAGMVLNFIDHAENEEYHRERGYTETICVRRPWRKQGLAHALIARSLRVLKAQGMTEAALGVDAQNPNGALRLYETMGFRTTKQYTVYRKPLE